MRKYLFSAWVILKALWEGRCWVRCFGREREERRPAVFYRHGEDAQGFRTNKNTKTSAVRWAVPRSSGKLGIGLHTHCVRELYSFWSAGGHDELANFWFAYPRLHHEYTPNTRILPVRSGVHDQTFGITAQRTAVLRTLPMTRSAMFWRS